MKLKIHIKSGHIKELSDKDLKKLLRALEVITQTATGKIPEVEVNVAYNTTG